MAKRRLNKKFVGILAGSIVGACALAVGSYFIKVRFFKETPDKYIALGRKYLDQKNYAAARDNLGRAASLSHPDPTLEVMLGDALNGLSSADRDNITAARGHYEHALGIDPTCIPAAERLIGFWRDNLDLLSRPSSRAQIAAHLRKTAESLLVVDSESRIGRSADAEAIIEGLIDGNPPDAKVNKDLHEKLIKLQAEDPTDGDIPYYLARLLICEGLEASRGDDPKSQEHFYVGAEQVMLSAEKVQDQNAYMHYRTGQILLLIASAERTSQAPSDHVKNLVMRAVWEIDRARQLAEPQDVHYVDISMYDAGLVLDRPSYTSGNDLGAATSQPGGATQVRSNTVASESGFPPTTQVSPENRGNRVATAEAIYRDVLKNRPNEAAARLALVDLLAALPGRRDDAIALLSRPLAQGEVVPGIKGALLPAYQAEADVKLFGLKMDSVEAARDKPTQDALLAECDALCDRVYGKAPDSATVLALKGRLELAHHHIVDATQTLRRALQLMNPQDTAIQQDRYELMYTLARACVAAQQTGEAKKLSTDIISVYSRFIPARLMLARLLTNERKFDEARPQVDFLESILPGNPQLLGDVIRLRIAALDKATEAQRIKGYYDRATENGSEQRLEKASIARLAGYDDEAIRLYSLVHAESPGDAEAATNLANLYLARSQKDKAIVVLHEAIAVNRSDPSLLALQIQIEGKATVANAPGSTPNQALDGAAAQLAAVGKELNDAEAARSAGDTNGREKHLAAAEKLKPDDSNVWDAMFTLALDQRNWDMASTYVEKLAANSVDHAGGLLYRVRFALAKSDLQRASELAIQLTREKPEFSQSWCVLGEVQKASGKYDDAIVNFQLALDRQTQNLDALAGLVECSYAQGNKDSAKKYIESGRQIAPNNDVFKEFELNHELNFGDPQKVIAPRMEAVKAAPDSKRNWMNLAKTYVAAAKARASGNDTAASNNYYAQAEVTLQEAIAKFPDETEFTTLFARTALAIGDFAAGEKAMLDLSNRDSHKGLARTVLTLADFYLAADRPDQAIKVFNDYLAHPAITPDHPGEIAVEIRLSTVLEQQNRVDDALAALSGNAQDPQIVRQKVIVLLNGRRFSDADKILDGVASSSPLGADLLNLRGEIAMGSGRLSVARQSFDQVIAADPNNLTALTRRAQTMLREPAPNYNDAIADLARVRDLSPADMEIRLLIADADRRRGQTEEAIKELETAVSVAPTNKRGLLYLLDLYANANPPRWSDAERVMRSAKAIPQFADDVDILHAEAIIAMGRGQLSRAQELIRSAMSKSPDNTGIIRTYYDILLKSKAFSQLLSHSDQFLSTVKPDPNLWWIYPYRAIALSKGAGDKAGAAQEYQHALTLAAALHDENASNQIIQSLATELGSDAALQIVGSRAQSDKHWQLVAATICQQKGDTDGALGWLEKVLVPSDFDKLSPADQNNALRLAAVEFQAKSPPDVVSATAMYRRLTERLPDDARVLNNLACLLIDAGPAYDPKGALNFSERAYKQVLRSGVDEPLIQDTYGWALIQNGQSDQGTSLIKDALGKQDFPEGHYHLAMGFLKRQPPSPDEAASELAKAMSILDQAERDGKTVDEALKSRVQDALKKIRGDIPG